MVSKEMSDGGDYSFSSLLESFNVLFAYIVSQVHSRGEEVMATYHSRVQLNMKEYTMSSTSTLEEKETSCLLLNSGIPSTLTLINSSFSPLFFSLLNLSEVM